MAQRINKKNKRFFARYTELSMLILVLVVFVVLFNKYIIVGVEKSSYYKNINEKISSHRKELADDEIRNENLSYNKQRNQNNKKKKSIISAEIVDENGVWKLKGARDYILGNTNGKLSIKSKNNIKNFSIDVSGIDSYYPINGVVKLDMPTLAKSIFFRVYEQEDFLPILGYHYVVDDYHNISTRRKTLEMHISDFDKQVNYMTNVLGCRWFTFKDMMENYILQEKKIPKRACVMNFDDGHKDSYTKIFPILQKYDIPASFYIITNMIGKRAYMTQEQIGELYRAGNEIGSHTLDGSNLVKTSWFKKKYGKEFNYNELDKEVKASKKVLMDMGYEVSTFAYPLGEWNNKIVKQVKKYYVAGRDTSRDASELDRRTPTVSYDKNFIWHMHYHKPELQSLDELGKSIGYNTWWQFEEGYSIIKGKNKSIRNLAGLTSLTENTYQVVDLQERGDRISNKFTINHKGNFQIEIFGSTGEIEQGYFSYLNHIRVYVDGDKTKVTGGKNNSCVKNSDRYYCSYFVNKKMKPGIHLIDIENDNDGFVRVDKFRIFRVLNAKDKYEIKIIR